MDYEDMRSALARREFIAASAVLGGSVGITVLLGACSDRGEPLASSSSTLITGRKWVQAQAFELQTGVFSSIDGYSDNPDAAFTSDPEFNGHAIYPSGEIVPLKKTADKDIANTLALQPQGNGLYYLEAGGVVQPPGGLPYEIRLLERTIPGTSVDVVTGYSYDPATGNRVLFSVSHDPIWVWVLVAVVMLAFPSVARGRGRHDQGGGG